MGASAKKDAIQEEEQESPEKMIENMKQNSNGKDMNNTPYRKNWLKNIRKENEDFSERLMNLRSSLEYSGFSKSI